MSAAAHRLGPQIDFDDVLAPQLPSLSERGLPFAQSRHRLTQPSITVRSTRDGERVGGRLLGRGVRDGLGLVEHLVGGHDLVDQAQLGGLLGPLGLAAQRQPTGPNSADGKRTISSVARGNGTPTRSSGSPIFPSPSAMTRTSAQHATPCRPATAAAWRNPRRRPYTA
jgi:hypothetical protein